MDRLRKLKGVIISVAFIGMAVAMLVQPSGLVDYMHVFGITPNGWAMWLLACAVANAVIGVKGYDWNGIWFAPMFAYTAAALYAYADPMIPIPAFTVLAYVLLSGLLLIEVLGDMNLWEPLTEA